MSHAQSHLPAALPTALVGALLGALVATACTPSGPTPEPTRTPLAAPWTSVPQSEQTLEGVVPAVETVAPVGIPTQAATLSMAETLALATQVNATIMALMVPDVATEPPLRANTAVPISGCGVRRIPPAVRVTLAADAPDAVKTWWASVGSTPRSLDGEVVASDDGGASTRIRSARDGASFEVTISTVPLPLSPGGRVRAIWHDEVGQMLPDGPGNSYGLFVGDDQGLVALIIAVGGPTAAQERLLAGERGGLTIRQLRSPCAVGESSGCGYTLHSAPASFDRGASSLTLGPGETGVLASSDGGKAYGVRLATSHVLLAENNEACEAWTPWPLSYSVVRR